MRLPPLKPPMPPTPPFLSLFNWNSEYFYYSNNISIIQTHKYDYNHKLKWKSKQTLNSV